MKSFPGIVVYELAGIMLICSVLYGCTTANKIYAENDIVYSTKRFELRYLVNDRNRRSPLTFFNQTIIKEINKDNEIVYTAYDVLTLNSSSFKPEEKVFLIIDNEAFQMDIEKIELENAKSISENTTDIPTSDSTSVSVVSGYSENDSKIARFCYRIPDTTIAKIKGANQMYLRYYSGPGMITVKPKEKSLKKIKQLIDSM